jgi:deazaflavin-dependent oxidoreductase (nitroreductase family)
MRASVLRSSEAPTRCASSGYACDANCREPVLNAWAGDRHNDPCMAHYQAPDWFTRHLFNPLVAISTRLGISVMGSRVLAVRGRASGEWRTTPVNLLELDGVRYLVAPRGQTQWVRNLRASGDGVLLLGRKRERFRATELADGEKLKLLRAYLKRWQWEVGMFFGGVGPESSDDELRRIAPEHPVFRLEPA